MTDRNQIRVIDSHTGGEPTRLVVAGAPDLVGGTVAEQLVRLRDQHDWIRTSLVHEPRGSEVMIGGVVTEPKNPSAVCGVIFFNNVGYLHMCGHGTIGLVATLAYLGRIQPGSHVIETPVGDVTAVLHETGEASFQNVPSYRFKKDVPVDVAGVGRLHGDIAWGGNWFFLCSDHREPVEFDNIKRLTEVAIAIRGALDDHQVRGAGQGQIDHIELFGPPSDTQVADSRSYVLCPGAAYDRSPCGTGTSAKLACLAADGKLQPGEAWRQESVIGSVFQASYQPHGEQILPTITGQAYVNADITLVIDANDPFRFGLKSQDSKRV